MLVGLTVAPVAALSCASLVAAPAPANDRVITSGQTVTYDTAAGPIVLDSLEIQAVGTRRVIGAAPLRLLASRSIRIDGTLDLSGDDRPAVFTLNVPNIPVFGALGGPAA